MVSRMETIHRLHNRHFIHLFISKPQMVTMDAVTNVGVVSIVEDTSVRYFFIFNILVSGFLFFPFHSWWVLGSGTF